LRLRVRTAWLGSRGLSTSWNARFFLLFVDVVCFFVFHGAIIFVVVKPRLIRPRLRLLLPCMTTALGD
jgi:hypothetical protein